MPSKSPAQARLMRAVAHGWKPDRIKGPSRAVAREFVKADEKWTGGLAAMNNVNSMEVMNYQRGGSSRPGGRPGLPQLSLLPTPPAPPIPAPVAPVAPTGSTIADMYGSRYQTSSPLSGQAAMEQASGGVMGTEPVDMSGFKRSGQGASFTNIFEQRLGTLGYIEDPTIHMWYPWQLITAMDT